MMMMMTMMILFLFKAVLQVLHMRFRVCENIMKWHEMQSVNDWRTVSVMVKCQNFNKNCFFLTGRENDHPKHCWKFPWTWIYRFVSKHGAPKVKDHWTNPVKMNEHELLEMQTRFETHPFRRYIFNCFFWARQTCVLEFFFWLVCGFGLLENLDGLRGGDWNNSRVRYSQGVRESQRFQDHWEVVIKA